MRATLSALVVLALIFGSEAAPAAPPAKVDDKLFQKTITTLSDVFKNLQLTEDQIQSLSKPKAEREQKLFQHGIQFCNALNLCKKSDDKSVCKNKTAQCFEGAKICAAAESLCLDIVKSEESPVCEHQRVICHRLLKSSIY